VTEIFYLGLAKMTFGALQPEISLMAYLEDLGEMILVFFHRVGENDHIVNEYIYKYTQEFL
jgi:hypothetical protein